MGFCREYAKIGHEFLALSGGLPADLVLYFCGRVISRKTVGKAGIMDQKLPSDKTNMSETRRHGWPVALIACLGVVFSLAVFGLLRSWEKKDADQAFLLAAEDRVNAIKGTFETEIAMLDLVRSSLSSDGHIERKEFNDTLAPFLARSSSIMAVEWVPRVPDSKRAEYEAAAQRDGIEGFQFTEMGKDGQLITASRREEYYPIYFIGPQVGNRKAFGYDIASEDIRRQALEKTRDSGKTVASGRIAFLQDEKSTDGKGGFFVCLPVYEKNKPIKTVEDRKKHHLGFIMGVFRPDQMLDSALSRLQPEGIDVGLYDPSDPKSLQFHASRTREGEGVVAGTQRLLAPSGEYYQARLNVAGHPWTVICKPSPAFQKAHTTWWPTVVLAVGLAFTTMLSGYVWMSIENRLHLEEKVREQTADIRAAQEEVFCRLMSAARLTSGEEGTRIRRVGLMSQALARAADWYGEDLEAIRRAAPMHDIGKIGIPDAILLKSERLTQAEHEVMKTHTNIGAEVFAGSKVPMLRMAWEIAQYHHERWDGKGYPQGLAGKNIPESARILAIIDTYDLLTHDTPGRPALSESDALAEMEQESGKQFDPLLLSAFVRRLPDIRRIAQQYPDQKPNDSYEVGNHFADENGKKPASGKTNGVAADTAKDIAPGVPLIKTPIGPATTPPVEI